MSRIATHRTRARNSSSYKCLLIPRSDIRMIVVLLIGVVYLGELPGLALAFLQIQIVHRVTPELELRPHNGFRHCFIGRATRAFVFLRPSTDSNRIPSHLNSATEQESNLPSGDIGRTRTCDLGMPRNDHYRSARSRSWHAAWTIALTTELRCHVSNDGLWIYFRHGHGFRSSTIR